MKKLLWVCLSVAFVFGWLVRRRLAEIPPVFNEDL